METKKKTTKVYFIKMCHLMCVAVLIWTVGCPVKHLFCDIVVGTAPKRRILTHWTIII